MDEQEKKTSGEPRGSLKSVVTHVRMPMSVCVLIFLHLCTAVGCVCVVMFGAGRVNTIAPGL